MVLRVRAYGQQGVEFSLSGPKSYERRGKATWCSILALILSSGALLSSVKWGVSSPSSVLVLGLVLAALAFWVFQATGNVIVEGLALLR